MSVLFQTVIYTGKLYSVRKTLSASSILCKCLSRRRYSDIPKKFITFDEIAAQRKAEARRSLVIQVNSESSFSELYSYCSKYASIEGVHHYKNASGEHFMLIEFSTEENLKDVIRSCSSHQRDADVMALQSPFLWFRAVPGRSRTPSVDTSLVIKDGCSLYDENKLNEELMECKTVSEQIQLLYDRTTLNDIGVRLRYMVARQFEMVFESLYSNVAVRPFGSSVNGFGKMGCDLDLVLTNDLTEDMCDSSKRLVYQEKRWSRQPLELAGALLEARAAGCARVTRILHARVPILKCTHDLAAVDCDLCYNNMSGVHMSELLWLLSALDVRVRSLTALVRRWARATTLTTSQPGRWLTNFPLTLLVLFFLQQSGNAGAVLPPVKFLVNKAGKEDVRIAEENINCTFLRDLNKLPPASYGQNQADLQTLLLQFFEFYSQFDFQEKAISVYEGAAIRKPNASPLYIVNPLQQSLNVSRNVSFEECERLKMEVRNAAWQLESCTEGGKTDDWGILSLIETKTSRGLKKLIRAGNSHRLVSVKDLFNDSEKLESGIRNKIRRLTYKEGASEAKDALDKVEKGDQKMKFKNTQIANEVQRIQRNKIL